MKKENVLGIILGIMYYILGIIFFFYLYVFEALAGSISDFSSTLFYVIYLIIPIILLMLPVILKFAIKKEFYKSILYSCIGIIIYIIIIILLTIGIKNYFKTFSTEKWSNDNWNSFRYLMIEDMENKYDFIGMTKDEVYSVLGKEDKKLEELLGEYVICYSMRNGFLEGDYYQIFLNEDDIVTKTDTMHWE